MNLINSDIGQLKEIDMNEEGKPPRLREKMYKVLKIIPLDIFRVRITIVTQQ